MFAALDTSTISSIRSSICSTGSEGNALDERGDERAPLQSVSALLRDLHVADSPASDLDETFGSDKSSDVSMVVEREDAGAACHALSAREGRPPWRAILRRESDPSFLLRRQDSTTAAEWASRLSVCHFTEEMVEERPPSDTCRLVWLMQLSLQVWYARGTSAESRIAALRRDLDAGDRQLAALARRVQVLEQSQEKYRRECHHQHKTLTTLYNLLQSDRPLTSEAYTAMQTFVAATYRRLAQREWDAMQREGQEAKRQPRTRQSHHMDDSPKREEDDDDDEEEATSLAQRERDGGCPGRMWAVAGATNGQGAARAVGTLVPGRMQLGIGMTSDLSFVQLPAYPCPHCDKCFVSVATLHRCVMRPSLSERKLRKKAHMTVLDVQKKSGGSFPWQALCASASAPRAANDGERPSPAADAAEGRGRTDRLDADCGSGICDSAATIIAGRRKSKKRTRLVHADGLPTAKRRREICGVVAPDA